MRLVSPPPDFHRVYDTLPAAEVSRLVLYFLNRRWARVLRWDLTMEDLVQDVLLRLAELPYDPKRGKPSSFITVVVDSTLKNILQHRGRMCRQSGVSRKEATLQRIPDREVISADVLLMADESGLEHGEVDFLVAERLRLAELIGYYEGRLLERGVPHPNPTRDELSDMPLRELKALCESLRKVVRGHPFRRCKPAS